MLSATPWLRFSGRYALVQVSLELFVIVMIFADVGHLAVNGIVLEFFRECLRRSTPSGHLCGDGFPE